jgi:hypothetical protein
VSNAHWAEVVLDLDSAAEHFTQARIIANTRRLDETGVDAYKAQMAFMHAMQCAHSSF